MSNSEVTDTLIVTDTSLRWYIGQSNNIVAWCLKAGILSEAEQTSIASQRFDNTHTRGNE
jgi:hypothetical protein